jgi:anti-sigma regulatory factor (Ser/Thr protein kinase)
MRQTLEPDAQAPAQARRVAESFLDAVATLPTISSGERRKVLLLVSELVTNAVQHGGPPIELRLTLTGHCLGVEVRDSGPPFTVSGVALVSADPPGQPHGRGLLIVDQLADHWGTRGHSVGKTIWCDVGIAEARPIRRQDVNRDEDPPHG